jgi:NAD-dependent deacetylase
MEFANQADVKRLHDLIADAECVVIFTGAGISTESGIPDFRSPGGLWTKYKPIDFSDFMASAEMRRESWRRKFAMDSTMNSAEPNRGHRAVAHLVELGKVSAIITQNVDGLHQASGVPENQVIELHGNTTYAKCLGCGQRHELEPIKAAFLADETMPMCSACGSEFMKTATISFGQAMPEDKMALAQRETLACDLFIAIGSSLVVYPAAGFPVMAKQNGAGMVILNREATDLDSHADLVINGEIGPTLGDAVSVN